MTRKDSPQSVIDSYRRRQQMAPYFLGGLALLLVVVGIIILVVWFSGSGKGKVGSVSLFASPTPTATTTFTPTPVTPTATQTVTPTVTITTTVTATLTPSGPYEYTVQEGDTCWDIAVKQKVDLGVLLELNGFGTTCPIKPNDKILIPQAGAALPTATSLPTGMAAGQKIEYTVQVGDTLALIAARFNTSVDVIMKENKLTDANKINAGDKLNIPANTITATPTKAPTKTVTPGGPTFTPVAPTATVTPKP
jgi:LysM repeat protein